MSNPIVADAPDNNLLYANFSTDDNAYLEGAGIFQDAANTLTDAAQGDWGKVGLDAVADALDLLGFVTDPFGVLLSAPIGWIIEHIGFLKEALDLVAGDPGAVRAKAQTWTNIAAALEKSSTDYQNSAKELQANFAGTAAEAYQRASANYTTAVTAAASHARDAAKAFEVAGTIVGTVRGAIRDTIAQFAADELIEGLAALAAAPETFGGSIAAWTVATVGQAASMAERNASKVLRAVREVNELAHGSQRVSTALRSAERDLAEGAARRASALTKIRNAGRDARAAEQKAEAARDGIRRAEEAQARARTRLANADNDAERTAAQGELRNAETREANQRGNLDEANRDLGQAHQQHAEGQKDYRDGLKHEPGGDDPNDPNAPKSTYEKGKTVVEKGHQVADGTKSTVDNYGDDNDDAKDKTKDLDDGSLV